MLLRQNKRSCGHPRELKDLQRLLRPKSFGSERRGKEEKDTKNTNKGNGRGPRKSERKRKLKHNRKTNTGRERLSKRPINDGYKAEDTETGGCIRRDAGEHFPLKDYNSPFLERPLFKRDKRLPDPTRGRRIGNIIKSMVRDIKERVRAIARKSLPRDFSCEEGIIRKYSIPPP